MELDIKRESEYFKAIETACGVDYEDNTQSYGTDIRWAEFCPERDKGNMKAVIAAYHEWSVTLDAMGVDIGAWDDYNRTEKLLFLIDKNTKEVCEIWSGDDFSIQDYKRDEPATQTQEFEIDKNAKNSLDKTLLDKCLGEGKYEITTLEHYMIDKYCKEIRIETEMRYPDAIDPCSKFPMDEEAMYRMEQDGYYDEHGRFKGNKEIIVLNPQYDLHIPREIDNLEKEMRIFSDIEFPEGQQHDYFHQDSSIQWLETQESLKKEYLQKQNNPSQKIEVIPEKAFDLLEERYDTKIKEYADNHCKNTIYKYESKEDGAYVYSSRSLNYDKQKYTVTPVTVELKNVKERIQQENNRNNSLFLDRRLAKILAQIIDTGDPTISKGCFLKTADKTPYKEGEEFDIEHNYVTTEDDLIKILKDGKLDNHLYVEDCDFRYYTQGRKDVAKQLNEEIPKEQNLAYISEKANFSIDFDHMRYEDDIDPDEYFDEDEGYYEDECPLVEFTARIISDDTHLNFMLKNSTVVFGVQKDGSDYISSPIIKSIEGANSGRKIQENIRNAVRDAFLEKTGEYLGDYLEYVHDEYEESENVPSIQEFLDIVKEERENQLDEQITNAIESKSHSTHSHNTEKEQERLTQEI